MHVQSHCPLRNNNLIRTYCFFSLLRGTTSFWDATSLGRDIATLVALGALKRTPTEVPAKVLMGENVLQRDPIATGGHGEAQKTAHCEARADDIEREEREE